ncbi:MAG: cell envelope biogenesis protein TolA [Lachnospiraceae bacterium]|nr:cell envelope biogenesis protein TolA [Lachnospiraceae bacterium]
MTKERIEKELVKVREQLAIMQARAKDLEEQKQMAEDAEKMKFIEKNKISLEQLILLNELSESEIAQLLKQKEEEELLAEIEKEKKEAHSHEKNEVIS